jgi:6-phospho-beta-glucosidase
MRQLKLTIIGAGSSYTPELIEELAREKETLPVKEIVLYDIDEKRLDTMTGFCRRYAAKLGLETPVVSTMELDRALYGADFVDTQIRVGGNKQRILDEKIPMKYGLVGQETTGAGGMMKAFRTIPVMNGIAERLAKLSPNAWIVNYTNPTGLITEAVTKYTRAKIAGFCAGGIYPKMWAKQAFGIEHNHVQYDFVGLNHMNFIYNITIDGSPVTEDEFIGIAGQNKSVDLELIRLLGVLPSPYLQWYYHTTKRVNKVLSDKHTRGEEVMILEKEIFEAYGDEKQDEKPAALEKRGGGGYSEVAIGFIKAIHLNMDTHMVVNVLNRGAVRFLPDDAVIETGCMVNGHGVTPLAIAEVPPMCWGLISAVKNYEQLAVEAAVEGNIRKAKLALLAHPLVREYELVEKLLPELLEANREYLPQFFGSK